MAPFFGPRFLIGVGAYDLSEKDGEYIVRLDAPGFSADQVKVEVDGDTLVVSGERDTESRDEGEGVLRWGRRHNSFERQFELGGKVDIDKVAASLDAGVLTIRLPKVEGDAKRHIQVVAGAESAKQVPVG
jgi:HSP20 family protein